MMKYDEMGAVPMFPISVIPRRLLTVRESLPEGTGGAFGGFGRLGASERSAAFSFFIFGLV